MSKEMKRTGRWLAVLVRNLFACAAVAGLVSSVAFAQAGNTTPDRGFKPAGSYSFGDIETINMTNGDVLLNIPLASLPGGRAGQSAGLRLVYNSKLYDQACGDPFTDGLQTLPTSNFPTSPFGGWHYAFDYSYQVTDETGLACYAQITSCESGPLPPGCADRWKLTLSFPDGSQHLMKPLGNYTTTDGNFFNVTPDGNVYSSQTDFTTITTNITYVSVDGTFVRMVVYHDSDTNMLDNAFTIYFPDGTRVDSQPGIETITDRNGNFVQIQKIHLNGRPARQINDQEGRSMTIQTSSDGLTDTIQATGFGGQTLTSTVNWETIQINNQINTINAPATQVSLGNFRYSLPMISQITLPAQSGSLNYQFSYNATWGELSDVTLPTGAAAHYSYRQDNQAAQNVQPEQLIQNAPMQKTLTHKTVYDGTTRSETDTWSYSIPAFPPVQGGSTSVTGPDGGTTTQYFAEPTADCGYQIYRIDAPDKVAERLWQANAPAGVEDPIEGPNMYLKTEFITPKNADGTNGQTAIKDYTIDKNGNPLSATEYDFVKYSSIPRAASSNPVGPPTGIPSGAVALRATTNSYYNSTPVASDSTTVSSNSYTSTTAPAFLKAVQSTQITDGTGVNIAARTEFTYDNPGTTANLTLKLSWDSEKGAISVPLTSTNSISAATEFDSFGNPTLITDPNGVQTQITYGTLGPSPGFSGLYPTQIVIAFGTSVARTEQKSYDFNTGVVTTDTDVDNGVSTTTACDAFGRPTLVQAAAGTGAEHDTSYEYSDPLRRVITRSDLVSAGDRILVSVALYDDLGRARLAQKLEDASSQSPYVETAGVKVQTRYKYATAGSMVLVSNPYRADISSDASSESTMGWTLKESDQAGRSILVQTFSGSGLPSPWGTNSNSTGSTATTYDFQYSTVVDPAGKTRRVQVDALGHHVRTDEPDSSGNLGTESAPSQPTSYTYDVLGNITAASQGAQSRSFTFSSLSRLVHSFNPERGNLSFGYDDNGNLIQRKDDLKVPVTTTFTYDTLNRLSTRSYSDGTPTVNCFYDPSIPFGKGRLSYVTTGATASAPSTSYNYTGYDAMGRPTVFSEAVGSAQYNMGVTYNPAGFVTDETYPSGNVVHTDYDAAGRTAGVKKSDNSGLYYAGAAPGMPGSIQYTAGGAMTSMKIGNGLWEHRNYNSRLQPLQIGLGTSTSDSSTVQLDYTYDTIGSDNNGDLRTQTITIDSTVLQSTYTYDTLDRLGGVTESGPSTWSQSYGYDRYGNRWVSGGVVPNPALTPTSQAQFNAANNRLTEATYDNVGNELTDPAGGQYTYDANDLMVTSTTNNISATYVYDADGQRVQKSVTGGPVTVYVYDAGGKPVAEYATTAPSAATYYVTADNLDSTRVVTDGRGAASSRHDFYPFGEEIAAGVDGRAGSGYISGPDAIKQKFTGKERDDETSLDYSGARYYSGPAGRFTSSDPSQSSARPTQPQSWNRYAYGINNPLKYSDTDGLDWYYDPNAPTKAPVWFTRDPGGPYQRWTGQFGYVYQVTAPGDKQGEWVALDPRAGRYAEAQDEAGANAAFDKFAGADFGIGFTLAQRDALAGFAEGISPLGPIAGYIHEAVGVDTTSREYKYGLAVGQLVALGLSVEDAMAAAAENASVTVGEDLVSDELTPVFSIIGKNKKAGDTFRDEIADLLRQNGYEVETEVYKKTPFGKRYMDVDVSKDGKNLGGIETKVGGSRYLPSQRAKDTYLRFVQKYVVTLVRKP